MNKKLIAQIDRELKAIEKEFDISSWDYQEVERMYPEEAFNRGFYRALEQVKSVLLNNK